MSSVQALQIHAGPRAIRWLRERGLQPADVDGLMYFPGIADQLRPADFHRHFGTTHDLWVSEEGGAMVWAATCPVPAARALVFRAAARFAAAFFAGVSASVGAADAAD